MNRDWAGDSNRTAAVEDAAGALNLAKPLVSSARRPIRGRQADSIAGLSDVKAAGNQNNRLECALARRAVQNAGARFCASNLAKPLDCGSRVPLLLLDQWL